MTARVPFARVTSLLVLAAGAATLATAQTVTFRKQQRSGVTRSSGVESPVAAQAPTSAESPPAPVASTVEAGGGPAPRPTILVSTASVERSAEPTEATMLRAVDVDPPVPATPSSSVVGGRPAEGILPIVRGVDKRFVAADTPLAMSSASGNAITVRDPNGTGHVLQVSLLVRHGTVSLTNFAGLRFTKGRPVSSSSMTFSGTTEDVGLALDGLSFEPERRFTGEAQLCLDLSYSAEPPATGSLCADQVEAYDADRAAAAPRLAARIPIVVTPVTQPPTRVDAPQRHGE